MRQLVPLSYTAQPPDSRFVRYEDSAGVTFIMQAHSVPLVGRYIWMHIKSESHWRRIPGLGIPAAIASLWVLLLRAIFGPIVGWWGFIQLCVGLTTLSVAYGYLRAWWYWRRALSVRVERDCVIIRDTTPLWCKQRTKPRDEIIEVDNRCENGIRLLGGKRSMRITGSNRADMMWLGAALAAELGVPSRVKNLEVALA